MRCASWRRVRRHALTRERVEEWDDPTRRRTLGIAGVFRSDILANDYRLRLTSRRPFRFSFLKSAAAANGHVFREFMRRPIVPASVLACAFAAAASAQTESQTPQSSIEQVVVTATRTPEANDRIPADTSVVTGQELRARDAWDMQTSLSLVSGVEAPAGGDAGPSSAVPSFWGLHEFDAFLLVVDQIPWGGAFNPAISTLDLTDMERVEVLKGSAPVMFGATSFVGVVQYLHYPAGQSAQQVDLAGGSYGSAHGSASFALPTWGAYRQSFAAEGESRGFADRRENVSDGHLLYRAALTLGPGELHIDTNLSVVRDVPPSPIVRQGATLTPVTPINANFNPRDA